MAKIIPIRKHQCDPIEKIAEEIVADKAGIKAMLMLTVDANGCYSFQMFNPDNDLVGMIFAHKLCGDELSRLVAEEYS